MITIQLPLEIIELGNKLFLDNRYTMWYFELIETRKKLNRINSKEYHKHHIIPKSLGVNNKKENIIFLTPREHYICHLLLLEMLTGINKSKMYYAFFRFNKKMYTSARAYEFFVNHYSYSTKGENNSFYKKTHTEKTKQLISEKGKGRDCYYIIWIKKYGKEIADLKYKTMMENKHILSGENHPLFNKKHSEETINKMKKAREGQKPSLGMKHSEETKKLYSINRSGEKNGMHKSKRVWITKDDETKNVLISKLDKFLDDGWKRE